MIQTKSANNAPNEGGMGAGPRPRRNQPPHRVKNA